MEAMEIIQGFLKSQCTRKYKRKTDGKTMYFLAVKSDIIEAATRYIKEEKARGPKK